MPRGAREGEFAGRLLSLNLGASGSEIRDIQLVGTGPSATAAAVLFTNANNCLLQGLWVSQFGVGIRYTPGANSSYLNTILGCRIVQNSLANIQAEKQTNALGIFATTFGSAPIGLQVIDSSSVTVIGGDVEGCWTACVDLDSSEGTLFAGHTVSGLHMEGNSTSGGDIRIGFTSTVQGVTLLGCQFGPNASNGAINAISCNGLMVLGYTMATEQAFLKRTNLTNEVIISSNTTNALPSYIANTFNPHYS